MDTRPATPGIGYGAFGLWYDEYRTAVLEPALEIAAAALERALLDGLGDRDLARIRSSSGRVKSKRRTWRKIHQPRYDGQVQSVEDIPAVVDDLIGLRVTCINVRDIEMVQSALDALPREPTAARSEPMWLEPSSERDYVAAPKESGYRGWHVNLNVVVDEQPVSCELQVRTLLQDSWGELTHEDTYSKDGALPPLVDVLSTRMADLLAILDDIAEDLRTELDRLDQEVVADDHGVGDDEVLIGQAADAAVLLHNRWVELDRPIDLAVLAWALQREFGPEISDDWFGHGAFKRFLRHAVPEAEISTGRQAYLLPPAHRVATEPSPDRDDEPAERPGGGEASGSHADDATRTTRASAATGHAPGAARQLRRIDPDFPLLAGAEWRVLFAHLTEAWRRVQPADAAAGTANRLARSARDLARDGGTTFSRRHVDAVVRTLLDADRSSPAGRPPAESDLARMYADETIERMVDLRILDASGSKAGARVARWIRGEDRV